MPTLGLDHVNIGTARLEDTRSFFVDLFDLVVGERPPLSSVGYWLYAGGQAVVHLVERSQHTAAPPSSALDHFALRMDGYDEVVGRLRRHDIDFTAQAAAGGRSRQLFLKDPNGVNIELNFRDP